MDLLDKTIDYIEENLSLYTHVQSIPLSSERDAISVLLDKSIPVEVYMDNSSVNEICLKILAKSEESKQAYKACLTIAKLLNRAEKGAIALGEGFCFLRAETKLNPYFQSMNTGQTYVYEAAISLFIKEN